MWLLGPSKTGYDITQSDHFEPASFGPFDLLLPLRGLDAHDPTFHSTPNTSKLQSIANPKAFSMTIKLQIEALAVPPRPGVANIRAGEASNEIGIVHPEAAVTWRDRHTQLRKQFILFPSGPLTPGISHLHAATISIWP